MAANDYHVIVYQILAYLYAQLKKGRPIDSEMLTHNGKIFDINKAYWIYIMQSLSGQGYVEGLKFTKLDDGSVKVTGLSKCQITPRGIEYVCDDYMLDKVRDYMRDKDIPEFI